LPSGRRTTTGNMQRGGRRKGSVTRPAGPARDSTDETGEAAEVDTSG